MGDGLGEVGYILYVLPFWEENSKFIGSAIDEWIPETMRKVSTAHGASVTDALNGTVIPALNSEREGEVQNPK
jgi:hypothetical protein